MRIKIEIGHVVIRHSFEWMGIRAVGEKNNLCLAEKLLKRFLWVYPLFGHAFI
jgi:hypothetical protein